CSSNGCGAASNTRRSICTPTTASAKLAPRSAATSSSTISVGRMRALTAPHPIKPTSLRCRSAWQPNLGRGFTYRCGKSVQTTGTTSVSICFNYSIVRTSRRFLAQVQGEIISRNREDENRLNLLQDAITSVFDRMNNQFEGRQFEFSNDVAHSIQKFLVRFDAIFTLNQDLLLEIH